MKFYKTHTKHVPYYHLPCIKRSSRYQHVNTLNYYEYLEKRTFCGRNFGPFFRFSDNNVRTDDRIDKIIF